MTSIYFAQATLSNDGDFHGRLAAAGEKEDKTGDLHPLDWATANIWQVAAAPGFAEAYASALDSEVPRPGADASVITDGMVLAAVQALP